MTEPFRGAKLAIMVGDRIVTILRDDIPTIPWPGHWDLPGGARDPGETPEECVLREVFEELGLRMTEADLAYRAKGENRGMPVWFFAAEWPEFDPGGVVFGNEGQEWKLAPLEWFLTEARTIPHQIDELKRYLANR